MSLSIKHLSIAITLLPLLASIIAGLFGKTIGRRGAHSITILCVAISCVLSLLLCKYLLIDGQPSFYGTLYHWAISGNMHFHVGFFIDSLSAMMMFVVTFVSLLVHIYSIGYMHDDPGYQRFFSYISLFTFAMLMLVTADNFMQLYFGWEGVGLVSYLLIGFWFKRDSANFGSLKAFLVNRVGDFGFLLGIGVIIGFVGSVDYHNLFTQAPNLAKQTLQLWPGFAPSVVTLISLLLFVGAMGKSAQVPLHVWLPESMEGPTPISALIHAATMVTAGVYMVSRMSPLFEYSTTALSVVLIVGATGALFTGLLAIVQTDIKRVVAYSTLSQLGYMVAALGASAYAAGLFHLVTHAFFKALLFLAAGSVILAMHHEQDIRKMGNLKKYLPITYTTFLLGSLSLSAIPPFSGFYSKDAIIEAVHRATVPGAHYAYLCVLIGAFVTAFYSFRVFFVTFHTKERMDEETKHHLHESPAVVWFPLVVLAIPSVILGMFMVGKMLYATPGLLGNSILVLPQHAISAETLAEYAGAWSLVQEAIYSPSFWLTISGIIAAWFCYVIYPRIPDIAARRFSWIYALLQNKYGFDDLYQNVFANGGRAIGQWLFRVTDMKLIDGVIVNGSGRGIGWLGHIMRFAQSGYLYHYALVMVVGLLIFLAWFIW